jgi:hypothetical protein
VEAMTQTVVRSHELHIAGTCIAQVQRLPTGPSGASADALAHTRDWGVVKSVEGEVPLNPAVPHADKIVL